MKRAKHYRILAGVFLAVWLLSGCGGGGGGGSKTATVTGVVSYSNVPVNGAQVYLQNVTNSLIKFYAASNSDINGNYTISNVTAGTYILNYIRSAEEGPLTNHEEKLITSNTTFSMNIPGPPAPPDRSNGE